MPSETRLSPGQLAAWVERDHFPEEDPYVEVSTFELLDVADPEVMALSFCDLVWSNPVLQLDEGLADRSQQLAEQLGTTVANVFQASVTLRLHYCTELFEPEVIDAVLGHFQRLVGVFVNDPELGIGQPTILSDWDGRVRHRSPIYKEMEGSS